MQLDRAAKVEVVRLLQGDVKEAKVLELLCAANLFLDTGDTLSRGSREPSRDHGRTRPVPAAHITEAMGEPRGGRTSKPSSGLEPETPSLPWNF